MADDSYGFCPHCGAKILASADYCTECGERILQDEVYQNKRNNATRGTDYLMWATILVGLYAVIASIGGIASMFSADVLVSTMKDLLSPEEFVNFLNSMGFSTEAQLRDYFFISGAISAISGVLALASTILCVTRKYWQIAVGACIVSGLSLFAALFLQFSGSGLVSCIIQLAIGAIVAYMIYMSRAAFTPC